MEVECTAYREAVTESRRHIQAWQARVQEEGIPDILNRVTDLAQILPPGVDVEAADPKLAARAILATQACTDAQATREQNEARTHAAHVAALAAIGRHYGSLLEARLNHVLSPAVIEHYGDHLPEALAPPVSEYWKLANQYRMVNLDGRDIAPYYDMAGPMFKAFVKSAGKLTGAQIAKALDLAALEAHA